MAKGRFAALAWDHDHCDLDLPMMMFQEEGDVPPEPAPEEGVVPVQVPVPKSSTPELEYQLEYSLEWNVASFTKKNVMSHDRSFNRMTQETREPTEPSQKIKGIEENPTPTSLFVHDAVEGEGAKRDTGASSSKLPMESPANADDTEDYMILEEGTHPFLEWWGHEAQAS